MSIRRTGWRRPARRAAGRRITTTMPLANRTVTAASYLPNSAYTPQGTVAGQFPNNQWIRGAQIPTCSSTVYAGLRRPVRLRGQSNRFWRWHPVRTTRRRARSLTIGENRLLTTNIAQSGGPSFVYEWRRTSGAEDIGVGHDDLHPRRQGRVSDGSKYRRAHRERDRVSDGLTPWAARA